MKAHKLLVHLLIASNLTALPACNGGANKNTGNNKAPITYSSLSEDPAFWDYAASSNMLQTQLGQLAKENGTTQEVKALGAQAVAFHAAALQELKQLATVQKNIQLPDSLGGADQGLIENFKALEGADFDSEYRSFMQSSHERQLQKYQEAMGKAENQRTRNWLAAMENHLRNQLNNMQLPDSVAETNSF